MRAAAALHLRDVERMSRIDTSIDDIKNDIREIRGAVSTLQTDVSLLKWMMGFSLAILVNLLGKALLK